MCSGYGSSCGFVRAAHTRDKNLDDIARLELLIGKLLASEKHSLNLSEADNGIPCVRVNALNGDGDNLLIAAFQLASELTLLRLTDSLAKHMLAFFRRDSADLRGLDRDLYYISGYGCGLILRRLLDKQIRIGIRNL